MTDHDLSSPRGLRSAMQRLRQEVLDDGLATYERWLPGLHRRNFRISALNLAYYLALRRRDIRPLQTALIPWGLSSLGRIEARVMPNLDAVIATLNNLNGESTPHPRLSLFYRGERMLRYHTRMVFGEVPKLRRGHIMVTMPTEAAADYDLVRDLLWRGMDCIRINCAHDDPDVWLAMITNLRRAEAETGRRARVAMDLSGPKTRTETVIAEDDHKLMAGDRFQLTLGAAKSNVPYPVQATSTVREVFAQVKPGAQVWFDDGKIGARVETVTPDSMILLVTTARPQGERLKPEKGMNFPDTDLRLPALSEKDLEDLDFVARHADIINYSFVQEAEDIELLHQALVERSPHPERIAIVAKVETKRSIRNLPEIMVKAAGQHPLGVMIARGDLAVEIGYQRLAEMQEEILWLCEAAHVPVIWATQVLEQLVKKGRPSRAEMTDAAMAERAECVMLNKGPYIREAVTALDDVFQRMQAHQSKKTAQLRALRSW